MNRSDLTAKLAIVSRALAQTNLVPVLQCVAFTGTEVIACDDALAIMVTCETDKPFVVDGNVLMGLLTNSTGEEVLFKVSDDLNIKAGSSAFKLPYMPIEEYLFEEPKIKPLMTLKITEDVIDGLNACLLVASRDQAQAAWMGVAAQSRNGWIALYSTNGDAVARAMTDKQPYTGVRSFLMPVAFCDNVLRAVEDTGAAKGEIIFDDEWAKASLDTGYTIYGRLLELDQPLDYEAMILQSAKGKLRLVDIPGAFDAALARARVVADPVTAPTLLTVEGAKLKLQTDSQLGLVNDSMDFGDKSYAVQAKVSAELVQRCAKLVNKMQVLDNCCVFSTDKLLILVSNLD